MTDNDTMKTLQLGLALYNRYDRSRRRDHSCSRFWRSCRSPC